MTRTRIWLMLWASWGTLLPPYISPILARFWHIVAYVLWLDLFINIWTWIVSHNTKYMVPLQVLWEKSHKMMLSIDTKNIGLHLWKCKKNVCMNSSMRLIVSIFGGENVPQHLYTNIQYWPTFHGSLLRSDRPLSIRKFLACARQSKVTTTKMYTHGVLLYCVSCSRNTDYWCCAISSSTAFFLSLSFFYIAISCAFLILVMNHEKLVMWITRISVQKQ